MTTPYQRERPLHRLLYTSIAGRQAAQDMAGLVCDILKVAVPRNAEVGVTGALLACNDWFLQALEGERMAVGQVYGRVLNDPRHEGLRVIQAGPIESREFGAWSMCGQALSPTDDAILRTLKTRGDLNPARFTAPAALRLLTVVGNLQARPAPLARAG